MKALLYVGVAMAVVGAVWLFLSWILNRNRKVKVSSLDYSALDKSDVQTLEEEKQKLQRVYLLTVINTFIPALLIFAGIIMAAIYLVF